MPYLEKFIKGSRFRNFDSVELARCPIFKSFPELLHEIDTFADGDEGRVRECRDDVMPRILSYRDGDS